MERVELTELKMSETEIPKDFLYALYEFAADQYVPVWGLCYGISKHLEIKISPIEADDLFEMVCESADLVDYCASGIEVLNTVCASEIEDEDMMEMAYEESSFEREVRPKFYYE